MRKYGDNLRTMRRFIGATQMIQETRRKTNVNQLWNVMLHTYNETQTYIVDGGDREMQK